jgi:hypothetical protein
MRYIRIVVVLLLVILAGLFAGRYAVNKKAVAAVEPKDCVLLFRETLFPADKTQPVRELSVRERWVRKDGSYKEFRWDKEFPRTVINMNIPEGRFIFNEQAKLGDYEGHFTHNHDVLTPESLRNSADFIRTDQLLGFTAYVWRKDKIEQWFVPEFGPVAAKTMLYSSLGVQIIEPFNVQFRPVTDVELAKPDLPVRLAPFQRFINKLRDNGRYGEADHKQEALDKYKKDNPNHVEPVLKGWKG